ncbi:Wzz/FepE/Etk N-terminal domain-containing protein [Sphingobacterium sp. KU25419]|nr:Wzz/FepE/Etk N-terminal domain-containing protein [Sphingobacterium sp. KU25419]
MEQKHTKSKDNQEAEINLRQLFEQYAFYWKWFVLSVLLALGIAVVYLRYAQKSYNTTAKILLKDERSASAGELEGIAELSSSMGLGTGRSAFVTDQIEVLSSRRLIRKVVDQHHLNIVYSVKGQIRSNEVLERDMPFIIQPHGDQDTVQMQLQVRSSDGNQLQIKNLLSNNELTVSFDKPVRIGKNVVTFRKQNKPIDKDSDYKLQLYLKIRLLMLLVLQLVFLLVQEHRRILLILR